MTTLQLVEKLVEVSPNVTIGFDKKEISYVGVNGVDYHLASIEDRNELSKVIDAIILLRQHGMV